MSNVKRVTIVLGKDKTDKQWQIDLIDAIQEADAHTVIVVPNEDIKVYADIVATHSGKSVTFEVATPAA